jgi:hypothetical protein
VTDRSLESDLRRVLKSRISAPATRLYVLLTLAKSASSDLAVRRSAGREFPLKPIEACRAIGIHRAHFRRYMRQLERAGLAECVGGSRDQILMYLRPPAAKVPRKEVAA